MKKRILSTLLVLCMICTMVPAVAFAADEKAGVPAPVGITEQFNLTNGQTYYFDLSSEVGKIGTINTAVPDTTWHYVPFTYAGTVNAYSLHSRSADSNTAITDSVTADNNTTVPNHAIGYKSNRSLFVADYNVSHTKSWKDLNTANLIFGKTFDTNYKLRSLSAGSSKVNDIGSPADNEWDSILTKNSGWIKNWSGIYSWGQDTDKTNSAWRALRGCSSAAKRYNSDSSDNYTHFGFRPALEVLDPATLGNDGLKAITLNLNGGNLNKQTADIKIVCAGATFTAPSGEGLTPPTGKVFDKWNTQVDGNGTSYDVGAAVPKSVTTLYAQWKDAVPTTTTITTVLDFTKAYADGGMSDKTSCVDGSGHTAHQGNPCWKWNNTTKTLTLNNVDIKLKEISGPVADDNMRRGIVLPEGDNKVSFSGNNNIEAMALGNSNALFSQDGSVTLTGTSPKASLNTKTTDDKVGITMYNGSVTITEGIIITNGIVGQRGVTISGGDVTATNTATTSNIEPIWGNSIKLLGGNVKAQAGIGCKPFYKEPKLTGMAYKAGSGTWDNKDGKACVYEPSTSTGDSGSSSGGSSSGGSSSGGSSNIVIVSPSHDQPNDPTKAEIKIDNKTDANGKTIVSVTNKTISEAINKATDRAKKNGDEANDIAIELHATSDKNATQVTVNLPKTVQDTLVKEKVAEFGITSGIVDLTFDSKTLKQIQKQIGGDAQIDASKADVSKLSEEAQKEIGDRPVFNLSITGEKGETISDFGGGSVTVAIPYTLQTGEDPNNLQAYFVDAKGKLHEVKSTYDPIGKCLVFVTDHFSIYAIGYKENVPKFTDVEKHWAKADIEFMAERGILSGTSTITFSPDIAMSRGMFVTALGRLAGIDTSSYKNGKFTDVKSEAYYAPYVNWAASKGITSGTTATTFSPNKNVTRQEMVVFMENYGKAMGETVPKIGAELKFEDHASIASWASEAVKSMQMAGVIAGKSDNKFDPTGCSTRAQVAAVIHHYVELKVPQK